LRPSHRFLSPGAAKYNYGIIHEDSRNQRNIGFMNNLASSVLESLFLLFYLVELFKFKPVCMFIFPGPGTFLPSRKNIQNVFSSNVLPLDVRFKVSLLGECFVA
jgi:hypothetical protein